MDKEIKTDLRTPQASLELLSPVADAVYFVPNNKSGGAKGLDLSSVSSDGKEVSYFIDGKYVGRGESGKALGWTMALGYHIVVAATTSKSARVEFVVKTPDD